MFSLSSSSQFSMDTMFADGSFKLLTNGEIILLIKNMVKKCRSESANKSGQPRENFIGSDFQDDCNVPSSSSDVVSRSLNSFLDVQPPEDLLNKGKDCPHVQTEAAGSSATKEDTRMSAVTETCPGLPRSCSLSQEEHKSQLDGNKNLGNRSQMFEVSVELGMQKKEKNLGINTVQDINSNNTEDQHDTHRKTTFCSILRDPQYEDISDYEDKSKPLSSEQYEDISDYEDKSKPLSSEQYEDVSEDENQCSQTSAELSGLDEVQIKNLIPVTKSRYCRSLLLQSEGLETNISCSVFKDKQELDNQHDDNDDDNDDDYEEEVDNWDVLSLSVSNLNFEDKVDGERGGKTSSSFRNATLGTAPNPVPASAFSQMEVFDTPAQQERAVKCGQVSFVVPSSSNHQQTSNIFGSEEELCSEAEDSCETDYSSDYSSGSESNYLTVSKKLVRNLSSSSLTNSVSSDFERKNRRNRTKNFQESSKEDIVCIDSDDDDDETKSSRNSEYSGTCPSNKAEPLKGLDPAAAQLQGGHTETTNLCQGTAKGSCAINKPTNSDDDVIIILSDSDDDDIIELGVEVMTPSLISVNSDFWRKEPTVDKEIPQGVKQSSAESPEPRPESSWGKPGTSRLIPPGEIRFHEPTRKVKDHTRKRVPSSETEEANVDDDLNKAENGLCTKKKKVKLSEASGSLGPVIPRMLVQMAPHSGEQVQLLHESAVQSRETDLSSNSSTVGSHSASFRKKSRCSSRDETGKRTSKLKCPKKVHNTPESKVVRSTFEPKRLASSLKGHPPYNKHSSSRPPFPLRSSSSSSASTQSVDQTNHARRKVFSDWHKNHVPLRRERKARGANYLRKSV